MSTLTSVLTTFLGPFSAHSLALVFVFEFFHQLGYLRFFWLNVLNGQRSLEARFGLLDPSEKQIDWTHVSTAPIMEEVIFRGGIYWLVTHGHTVSAVAVTCVFAVLFAYLHRGNTMPFGNYKIALPWFYMHPKVVSGLYYGGIVIVTKALWPAMLLHALWNLVLLAYYRREKDCERLALFLTKYSSF